MDWLMRLPTISIHPDMADREDVARMSGELMEARALLCFIRDHSEMARTIANDTGQLISLDNIHERILTFFKEND